MVSLPGADKSCVDLYQASADVVIKAGNFKRNIPLPNVLKSYVITGAKFEKGYLEVTFGKEA